jgi:O-6-methylguanine DNA methyltransferase
MPEHYRRAVVNAAAGRDYAPVPVDLSGVPGFHLRVLEALRKVPRGTVKTYGDLAKKAGNPRAARAVGSAMAHNPIPFLVPCHRVVPSSGGIGNFGLGKARKLELLRREGVDVGRL